MPPYFKKSYLTSAIGVNPQEIAPIFGLVLMVTSPISASGQSDRGNLERLIVGPDAVASQY